MADPNTHLKLDHILAMQDALMVRIGGLDETQGTLIAAIAGLRDAIDTQNETISRLANALSEEDEGGGGVAETLASIAVSLRRIQQDGARTVVLLGRLPDAVAQAARDAAAMAAGDGVDIPSGS